MVHEQNGFLEYLELQDGRSSLVTKSELLANVRKAGYSISDRQLTFYVSEGLVPRSVRVGTRAGAYPTSVVWLMEWILEARDAGASIDALKELLPVWKFLVRARNDNVLNLGEFEYVARQHVTSYEASLDVPRVVTSVLMRSCCSRCLRRPGSATERVGRTSARNGKSRSGPTAFSSGGSTPIRNDSKPPCGRPRRATSAPASR